MSAKAIFKASVRTGINVIPLPLRHWVKHVPGLAALQRWLVNSVISHEPFVHTVNVGPAKGLHFEVTLPLDKAIWAGTYESEFTQAIAEAIRPGDVCFDVGGYRGYVCGVMALAGAAEVYVFEPHPENQSALRSLQQLNPSLPIQLIPIALGDTDGSLSLRIMSDSSMAKLATSPFQSTVPFDREIAVTVRRMDSLVDRGEVPAPNVIKLDVEGAELSVLRGALATIRAYRPRIYLEAHSLELERRCREELTSSDYEISRIEAGTLSEDQTRHLICLPK
jgi:FkbM family methyltransferase